jgi:hypothetical protein
VKTVLELSQAVLDALDALGDDVISVSDLTQLGSPPEEVRRLVARLDLSTLAEALTALEIALDVQQPLTIEAVPELSELLNAPVPADSLSSPPLRDVLAALPDFEHSALASACGPCDGCGPQADFPADVHAAHPVVIEMELQSRPPSLAEIEAAERSLRIAEYAIPLGEVEDALDEASRATGIPVPKAVRS